MPASLKIIQGISVAGEDSEREAGSRGGWGWEKETVHHGAVFRRNLD